MNTNQGFTANHIRFEVGTLTPLLLPGYAGPSIRGALFGALRQHFCPLPRGERPTAEHKALCPVCWLMATERPESNRGRDVPRPYTVEPPGANDYGGGPGTRYDTGARFSFGLTLYAQAMNLFPYLVMAMPIMGRDGIGVPLRENGAREGQKRRGQFKLCCIEAVNPITGEVAPVMGEGQTRVHLPDMPATDGDVSALTDALLKQLDAGRVCLSFNTPTRIVERGRLIKQPWLGPLVRRLIERIDALHGAFANEPPIPDRERLVTLADRVRLVDDQTRWVEVKSQSRRLGRSTWVSGYVGHAVYQADPAIWQALLPYLLWGQVTHVGKNATKGNGWYKLGVDRCQSSNI